jgi:Zn-dependent protease with chaperone function
VNAHATLAKEGSVDAARAYVPAIVGWAPVIVFPMLAFVAGALCTTIVTAIALDRRGVGPDVPWPERARAVFPARSGANAMLLVTPVLCLVVLPNIYGVLGRAPSWLLSMLIGSAAIFGAHVARGRLERRIGVPWSVGRSVVNAASLVSILAPHWVAPMLVVALSRTDSLRGALVSGFAALAASALALRGNLALARLLGVARPAPARVQEIVAQVADATQTPVLGVYELRLSMANALALPLHRAVLFTQGALATLTDEEIAGICAHELAHLRESRAVLAGRIATWMAPAIGFCAAPIVRVTHGDGVMMAVLAVGFAAYFVGQRLSQSMETRADAAARAHERSEGAYARALARLYEANLLPLVLSAAPSHPHLFDRLTALGAPPPFPRPKPPSMGRLFTAALLGTMGVMMSVVFFPVLGIALNESSTMAFVLTGGRKEQLTTRAYERITDEPKLAEALFRACLADTEDDSRCAAGLAASLSRQPGRCADARRVADLAAELLPPEGDRADEAWIRHARERCAAPAE